MLDCLIPARGGSKGVKNKNIYPVHDVPLIAYTIKSALDCPEIRHVYVSTDSEQISSIAKSYGAFVPFLRPAHLAADSSLDREVFTHFNSFCHENKIDITTHLVHLRATSPVRNVSVLTNAINFFLDAHISSQYTSLRSIHNSSHCPFKWFKIVDNTLVPLFTSENDAFEHFNLPRQHFPPVLIPNGYIDIVPSNVKPRDLSFHGSKILPFITESSYDIDTLEQLLKLEESSILLEESLDLKNGLS